MKFRIDIYIEEIKVYHELVARKLTIAQQQLINASSIEEYQQIGVLLRDAWIEFVRKLFSLNMIPADKEPPSSADVNELLKIIFKQWPNYSDKIRKQCEILFSLTNEIQHRTSIDKISTAWCLINSAIAMEFLIEIDTQENQLISRTYYKCPKCGSLNLDVVKDRECDWDGPGAEYESWQCMDCDWHHLLYLS